MHVHRIYTGADGQSHFEDLDVPLSPGNYGALSSVVPITGVVFRETYAGGHLDFHVAPRRQFVVTLEGECEIECGSGEKRRLGPGDVMLADDLTGQGHISREVGTTGRRSLFLILADGVDVSPWRRAATS